MDLYTVFESDDNMQKYSDSISKEVVSVSVKDEENNKLLNPPTHGSLL